MKLKLDLPFKILIILITLLIVLNVLDILLTKAVLHHGGGEANVRFWWFNTIGIRPMDYIIKIGLSFLMGVIIFVLYWASLWKNSKFGFITTYVILIALDIFYSYIVVHNIQILIAQKQIWENWQHISNIR